MRVWRTRYEKLLEMAIDELKAQIKERDQVIRDLLDRFLIKQGVPPTSQSLGDIEKEMLKGANVFEEVDEKGRVIVERDEEAEEVLKGGRVDE